MNLNTLRTHATGLAAHALKITRQRAAIAVERVESLKGPLKTLSVVGQDLREVARRHGSRFVAQNVSLATAAGKDVSDIATSAFASLVKRAPAKKAPASRKTTARKRRVAKAA